MAEQYDKAWPIFFGSGMAGYRERMIEREVDYVEEEEGEGQG